MIKNQKKKNKKETEKSWWFNNREEAIDFYITALTIQTPYLKIVQISQKGNKYKVKIIKL